ncbi:hypothetical protein [Kribbella sp.]|uniref:sunset domain-containing protein n=1 Tax=Kribbella sp. TaxID=1871183 RepID=UPI002D38BC70|nr:hypothetical protein [Kribbella sp.]HZX06571.1 hypothetical protein [Kribbella sp.]
MSWLLRDTWLGSLLAFVLGATITWLLLDRHHPATTTPPQPTPQTTPPPPQTAPVERRAPQAAPVAGPAPAARSTPAKPVVEEVGFSQLMDVEPTLFDHMQPDAEPAEHTAVPPGRYGEGSADAVPHQGPPDGFTIKGNAQSMLFHTPDSPYYGRTKPEVWFRTESDAERAGFTKYARRPRKSPDPRA